MNLSGIKWSWPLFAALLIISTVKAMGFEPPGPQERINAIGRLDELPPQLRPAFVPDDDFHPIPRPGPGDWLSVHPEAGQTFDDYVRLNPPRPSHGRNRIYIQPLGEFAGPQSPPLDPLARLASAFFQMEVKPLEPIALGHGRITTRRNPYTHQRQLLTTDILSILHEGFPADAFCVLGVTMEDLYPHPSWNFVFGQASLEHRVGVFSFARYSPTFYGEKREAGSAKLLLLRSFKVLAHETCHMFHMSHCIYFHCLMNGSNHLRESDARPLHLCPVCLGKLHWSIGFDPIKRYEALLMLYERYGFNDEAKWMRKRVEKIKRNVSKQKEP